MRISRQEAIDNHARLVERNAVYLRNGYDEARNLAFVLSHTLPLPGRILEIGTGKGRFLVALLSRVAQVTTIDIDPEEQHHARLNVAHDQPPGRARFVIADAEKLPWPDRSFDSVVSMNALHHMKDLTRMVEETLRVVCPAGKIVLADFSEKGFAIVERMHLSEGRVHVRTPYRFQGIGEHFAANGWNAVLRSDDCQEILIAAKTTPERQGIRFGGRNSCGNRRVDVSASNKPMKGPKQNE